MQDVLRLQNSRKVEID